MLILDKMYNELEMSAEAVMGLCIDTKDDVKSFLSVLIQYTVSKF